ncbi:MAG TPA: acyltransferase [Mucilaginibacter sp.]|nr:acyltransferase [Mucilaginibacter sp.]
MRIKHIDALRGIAAIIITFFHLSGSSGLSMNFASYGKYGYLGVEIFFVISGFILPYSMHKTGYDIDNFGRFILKRIIRIYPAYLVAILVGIALPLLTGRVVVSMSAILSHVLFLNSILGLDWISPVFWTLAIEFQFYILIGLLYKYISHSNSESLMLIGIVTGSSFFLKNASYIFYWFPFFSLGILIYNRKFTSTPKDIFWVTAAMLLAIITYVFGLPETIAAGFAFLFIVFIKMENTTRLNKVMLGFGTISYPLYLVHWEVGRAAARLTRHIPKLGDLEIFKVFIGLIISIFTAYLLYLFVEKSSIRYSSKIKYFSSRTKVSNIGQA